MSTTLMANKGNGMDQDVIFPESPKNTTVETYVRDLMAFRMLPLTFLTDDAREALKIAVIHAEKKDDALAIDFLSLEYDRLNVEPSWWYKNRAAVFGALALVIILGVVGIGAYWLTSLIPDSGTEQTTFSSTPRANPGVDAVGKAFRSLFEILGIIGFSMGLFGLVIGMTIGNSEMIHISIVTIIACGVLVALSSLETVLSIGIGIP